MYLGVKAVIAKSIERIHMDNLVNFGILPLFFVDEADYDSLNEGDELVYAANDESFATGTFTIENKTQGKTYTLKTPLNERQLLIVREGGKLNYFRNGGQ